MPQVRCPSCGITINLEGRRETDYELVLSSLRRVPKTFTDLLHETRLPRKTLSLRLKELIESGAIIKDNGYRLNGSSASIPVKSLTKKGYGLKSRMVRFIRDNPHGNRDAFLIGAVFVFMILGPLMFVQPFTSPIAHAHSFDIVPSAGGEFNLVVGVQSVDYLYAWQGKIRYNPNVFQIKEIIAGNFLSANTLVLNSSDSIIPDAGAYPEAVMAFSCDGEQGMLFIGGTLIGDSPGKTGDGKLAVVTFEVLVAPDQNADMGVSGDVILLNPDLLDAKAELSTRIET